MAFAFPRKALADLPTTQQVQELSLSAVCTESTMDQIKEVLLRDASYFQHHLVWTPLTVTTGNVTRAARACRTLVSRRPNGVISQVSFSSSMPFRSDVYFYGSSSVACLDHFVKHLHMIRNVTRSDVEDIGVIFHFSYSLNVDLVQEKLGKLLGPRHTDTNTFRGREGLVYYNNVCPKSKY